MDESFEAPTALKPENNQSNGDDASSGEDDEGPDWTKIPTTRLGPNSRPVIPKRGEKEFEPLTKDGSARQQHVLDRAREAMFSAISVTRSTSSKTISYATWAPTLSRAYVTTARGTHFTTMGQSVPRIALEGDGKVHKRLELLPEETLYLVERGSMFCWKEYLGDSSSQIKQDDEGVPMSVQQCYAEMIGKVELTLEKYQVYAHLKRLGFVLTRARPPDEPRTVQHHRPSPSSPSWFSRICSLVFPTLQSLFFPRGSRWKPLAYIPWFHRDISYPSLFARLRFIPAGFSTPIQRPITPLPQSALESPFRNFYHVYKPSTPYRKTQPPPPDFQLVVVNARTTNMPSLLELVAAFDGLPNELPTSRSSTALSKGKIVPERDPLPVVHPPPPRTLSFFNRIYLWLFPEEGTEKEKPKTAPKPNLYQSLKMGNKSVVIAVVDCGSISFFRFGQGCFEQWPIA